MGDKPLTEINGIGASKVKILEKAKIYTIEDLAKKYPKELSQIEGIGFKSASKWIAEANRLLSRDQTSEKSHKSLPSLSAEYLDETFNKIYSDIHSIIERVDKIEKKLYKSENMLLKSSEKTVKGQKLLDSISEHPFIRNETTLLEVIIEKVNEMTEKWLGIREVTIEELYKQIIKDYSITREIFVEYLLMLFRSGKINLEPRSIESGFSIRNHDGISYQVVKLTD
jgi:nucleotidyltransferase/DNA polymerase involved in DNA repair